MASDIEITLPVLRCSVGGNVDMSVGIEAADVSRIEEEERITHDAVLDLSTMVGGQGSIKGDRKLLLMSHDGEPFGVWVGSKIDMMEVTMSEMSLVPYLIEDLAQERGWSFLVDLGEGYTVLMSTEHLAAAARQQGSSDDSSSDR